MEPSEAPAGVPVLEVRGLEISYGPVVAATDVFLRVNRGEIVALLGPNGAGKTSVLKAIMGLVRPSAGRVDFLGDGVRQEITRLPTHDLARLGIVNVPSAQIVLPRMTVEENLLVGGLYLLDDRRGIDFQPDLRVAHGEAEEHACELAVAPAIDAARRWVFDHRLGVQL